MNLNIRHSYHWDHNDFFSSGVPNGPPSIETFYFTTP